MNRSQSGFQIKLNESALYHAYGLFGERNGLMAELIQALERDVGLSPANNPDFLILEREVLTVDDARDLRETAFRRSFAGGKKILVAAFDSATREAENALLKITEEPPAETIIFLLAPTEDTLTPTLLSRLSRVKKREPRLIGRKGDLSKQRRPKDGLPDPAEFVKAPISKRLSDAKDLANDYAAERVTKNRIIGFLGDLQTEVALNFSTEASADCEEWLIMCRKYLSGRSSSVKQILESVAVVLPLSEKK